MDKLTFKSSKFYLSVIICFVVLTSISCAPTEGQVNSRIREVIQIGMTKNEVLSHLESLEVNGINAVNHISNETGKTIVDGKEMEISGTIGTEFRGRGIFASGAFAIFYFDKSEKLINYFVEAIY